MPTSSRPLPAGKLPGDMLQRLISEYRTPTDDSVVVNTSYGFDAAAISIGGETIVVKSDPITFPTSDAARYLIAVNANDIACMGGVPKWMTVVALLPEVSTTPESVEALFSDLKNACVAEGIMLIGGHTEITIGLDRPLLIGTLIGTLGEHGLLHPGEAVPGDELYVTKSVGIEGTAILAGEMEQVLVAELGVDVVRSAKSLLDDPGISITRDAAIALGTGTISALHDPTEGGLATAIHEIAEASRLGARIDADAIPILPSTRLVCDHLGINPLGLLSSGALLIAAHRGSQAVMSQAFAGSGIDIRHIGMLTNADDGCTIVRRGEASPLPRFDSDELARALTA